MGKIRWTDKATSHLHSIFDYIAQDSKTYAIRFTKSLVKSTQKLTSMPYCGRIVPEFEPLGFRELIYHNYRIVYRVIGPDQDIEILAVVHGARELHQGIEND